MTADLPSDVSLIPNGVFDHEDYGSSYLVGDEELFLVDPGTSNSVSRILDWFEQNSISPSRLKGILLTHIHLDHAGATGHLVEKIPNLDVYVHGKGKRHLVDPTDLLQSVEEATGNRFSQYGTLKPVPEDRILTVNGRSTISFDSREVLAVSTPGHAPHHVVFQDKRTAALFTGDAAGLYLDGRLIPATPPPSFDLDKSLESLDKMAQLDPSVLLYSHYGPGRNPERELKAYGKLLRDWVSLIGEIRSSCGEEEEIFSRVIDRNRDWLGNGFTEEELIMNVRGALRYLSWKEN